MEQDVTCCRKKLHAFKNICNYCFQNNMPVCRKIVNNNDEVLATVLLLKDEKRLYNLMPATTIQGRKMQTNHYSIDCILHEFAGPLLLFDFEGSDCRELKTFIKALVVSINYIIN